MIMHRPIRRLTIAALSVSLLLVSGCTASIHRTANHNPLKLRHQRHLPYYHCPICGTIVPKTSDKHICHVLNDVPYFGHQATCWQAWPTDWVGCPVETIGAPVDTYEASVRELPLPRAPEYQALNEQTVDRRAVESSYAEPQAEAAPPQTSVPQMSVLQMSPIDYPMIRTPPLADESLSNESLSNESLLDESLLDESLLDVSLLDASLLNESLLDRGPAPVVGPALGDARSARPIFEAPAPKIVKAPAPKPKIVEAPKSKIVSKPAPKIFEAPKVVAKAPVARSVTRVKMPVVAPIVTSSNRASQTASLKLVATSSEKAPKKMATALAETMPTETATKVATSTVTSAKLKITPVGEMPARRLSDIRIASRVANRVSTIPSRSPQIRFRSETNLKLKESSVPPTDPAKTPTPKRFRLAQR